MIIERERGAAVNGSPFLTVVTRCYRRPEMLEANKASLQRQSDPDYEQVFVIDREGLGLHAANKALALAKPQGQYVLILDDDDVLTDPDAIAALKVAVKDNGRPDLLFFRADHAKNGILPDEPVWRRRPQLGHVGSCDFISRLDVWRKYIPWFGAPAAGDYHYLLAVWKDAPGVAWLDRQLAAVQRISNGRPE